MPTSTHCYAFLICLSEPLDHHDVGGLRVQGVEAIARVVAPDVCAGDLLEAHMMDVVYLGLTLALVALTWGLVRLFERVA